MEKLVIREASDLQEGSKLVMQSGEMPENEATPLQPSMAPDSTSQQPPTTPDEETQQPTDSSEHPLSEDPLQSGTICLRKVFVGGLKFETTAETIKQYFQQWGDVEKVITPRANKKLGRANRGFCYVLYFDFSSVEKVLNVENHSIDGRPVELSLAHNEGRRKKKPAAAPSSSPKETQSAKRKIDTGKHMVKKYIGVTKFRTLLNRVLLSSVKPKSARVLVEEMRLNTSRTTTEVEENAVKVESLDEGEAEETLRRYLMQGLLKSYRVLSAVEQKVESKKLLPLLFSIVDKALKLPWVVEKPSGDNSRLETEDGEPNEKRLRVEEKETFLWQSVLEFAYHKLFQKWEISPTHETKTDEASKQRSRLANAAFFTPDNPKSKNQSPDEKEAVLDTVKTIMCNEEVEGQLSSDTALYRSLLIGWIRPMDVLTFNDACLKVKITTTQLRGQQDSSWWLGSCTYFGKRFSTEGRTKFEVKEDLTDQIMKYLLKDLLSRHLRSTSTSTTSKVSTEPVANLVTQKGPSTTSHIAEAAKLESIVQNDMKPLSQRYRAMFVLNSAKSEDTDPAPSSDQVSEVKEEKSQPELKSIKIEEDDPIPWYQLAAYALYNLYKEWEVIEPQQSVPKSVVKLEAFQKKLIDQVKSTPSDDAVQTHPNPMSSPPSSETVLGKIYLHMFKKQLHVRKRSTLCIALRPKSPITLLEELRPGCAKYAVESKQIRNIWKHEANCEIGAGLYIGQVESSNRSSASMLRAKEEAADKALQGQLRYRLLQIMDPGPDGERFRLQRKDDIPFASLLAFALYRLFSQWQIKLDPNIHPEIKKLEKDIEANEGQTSAPSAESDTPLRSPDTTSAPKYVAQITPLPSGGIEIKLRAQLKDGRVYNLPEIRENSPFEVLNTLWPTCTKVMSYQRLKSPLGWVSATMEFENQQFSGKGESKTKARNVVCEDVLKFLLTQPLSKVLNCASVWETDFGEEDSEDGRMQLKEPKGWLCEEVLIPWRQMAGLALYRLSADWQLGTQKAQQEQKRDLAVNCEDQARQYREDKASRKRTHIKDDWYSHPEKVAGYAHPGYSAEHNHPRNDAGYSHPIGDNPYSSSADYSHPVAVLNQLKFPKFEVNKLGPITNPWFSCKILVDGLEFYGEGKVMEEAKAVAAELALSALNIQYKNIQ